MTTRKTRVPYIVKFWTGRPVAADLAGLRGPAYGSSCDLLTYADAPAQRHSLPNAPDALHFARRDRFAVVAYRIPIQHVFVAIINLTSGCCFPQEGWLPNVP